MPTPHHHAPSRLLAGVAARAAALLFACAATLPAGCVGFNVYPAAPGERGFTNVNSDPFPPIITAAVQWAVTRYPPDAVTEFSAAAPAGPGQTPFAINLPTGMNEQIGRRIVTRIGFNAQPLVPGNERLPIYHVARIAVSGDDAKVDIVRPVLGIPATGGRAATQGLTLRLRGGLKPWTVTSHRVWSFNAMPAPALNYLSTDGAGQPEMNAPASEGRSTPTSGDSYPQ